MIPGRIVLFSLHLSSVFSSAFCQLSFTEITSDAGIDHHYLGINDMGGGAAFFDMDNDGDEDLWISGGLNRDVLYLNDGTGKFSEIGESAGLRVTDNVVTTGVITGDVDNDGFTDVWVITHRGFSSLLFRNNGDGTFSNLTGPSGLSDYESYSLAAAMADVNLDGYLDIYEANYIERDRLQYDQSGDTVIGFAHDCHSNRLFLNQGDWTFIEVAQDLGVEDKGCALAAAFSDYDADFDPDLFVANDFGEWVLPNALYQNQSSELSFQDVSPHAGMNAGIYAMGIAIGDYDKDQDLDYYITNIGQNIFLENQGDGTFKDVTEESGTADIFVNDSLFTSGWGTGFVDFDNDADLDLYVVNGFIDAAKFIENDRENPNRLYENNGSGFFSEIGSESQTNSALRGRGFASADIDRDGDIDFLVINTNRQATSQEIHSVQLFRNEQNSSNNWLEVDLQGTTNNQDGCGARVLIFAGSITLMQEAHCGYGTHTSQHSRVVHFGLGEIETIDSLVVVWPGGTRQVDHGMFVNQLVSVSEDDQLTTNFEQELGDMQLKCFPNPFKSRIQIQYSLSYSSTVEIQIFDSLGRLLQSNRHTVARGDHSMEWKVDRPGSYVIRLKTDHDLVLRKILSL